MIIDELELEVKEVGDGSSGLKSLSSSITKLKNVMDKINKLDQGGISKLRDMAQSVKDLSVAGQNGGLSVTISQLNRLGKIDFNKINASAEAVERLKQALEMNPNTGIGNGKTNIPSGTENNQGFDANKIKQSSSLLSQMGKGTFTILKQRIAESTKGLGAFFGSIKRIALYRGIRTFLKLITEGISQGINNAYQWSKAIGGTFAQSMDSMASSFAYLKNSIGAVAIPILNAVAPAVEFLTDKFVNLLNVINQVFSRLSGSSTWTRAVKTQTEFAKATGDTAKEVKNLLSGFDEINNIGGSSGSASGNTNALSGYKFVEEPLDTVYVDNIIEKLKDILWYVGAVTAGIKAWKFGKALADLIGIKDALAFATGLGLITIGIVLEFKGIKGILTDGISGKNVTETILGGLGLTGGGALLGKSIAGAIGTALGAGIGGVVASLPATFAGVWSSINEGISWLSAMLTEVGTTGLGASIGAIIGSLGGPIGTGVGALIGVAVGGITNLVIAVAQHGKDIENWWFGTAVPWLSNVGSSIGNWFSERLNSIKTWWSNTKTTCSTNVSELKTSLTSKITEIKDSVVGKITEIKTKISDKFTEIKNTASTLFTDLKTSVSNFFGDIGTTISNKFKDILNKYIISPLNKVIGWANDKLHFSYSGLRILGKQVIPSFSVQLAHLNTLPSLNVGTNYVPEDQLAFIHQGEAVVPKEFNSKEFFGQGNEETNEILSKILGAINDLDLNVSISGDDVGKASVKYINKQQRRMGVSLV